MLLNGSEMKAQQCRHIPSATHRYTAGMQTLLRMKNGTGKSAVLYFENLQGTKPYFQELRGQYKK